MAKTLIANSFATALGLQFKRIQFTPDLMPGDITGGYIFDHKQNEFVLRKGPIFTNILLADEINRASPKTQSALLEAMQEHQVTLEGETHKLPILLLLWLPKIQLNTRALFLYPKPSSTDLWPNSRSGIPNRKKSRKSLQGGCKGRTMPFL